MKHAVFPSEPAIFAQSMILIGSSGRNSGKTTLAMELIRRWKVRFSITALKVTTIAHAGGACHRGGEGCGACSIASKYVLEEEQDRGSDKDTIQMLRAGAAQVFWLRSLRGSLAEAYTGFLEKALPDTLIICESNSLREVVQPGCFIMLKSGTEDAIKASAAAVANLANITLPSPLGTRDMDRLLSALVLERTAQGRPLVRFVG
ncbi:MAG: hypothetical protein LBT14_02550 [Treponema sp.]|jgi:hypothetical protein|nr:hypothetical protein [Treponema sp.]